jgi:hypothetical protein
MDLSTVAFAYDPATQTATWTLPTTLADANYRATLSAAAVRDSQGKSLDGNSDGTPGDDFVYDLFHLTGDANQDRTVNHLDFQALYANFGQAGRQYTHGDFNFDGTVDFKDFQMLERAFGKTLAAPAPAAASGAPPAPSPVPTKPARPAPIAKPAEPKPASPAGATAKTTPIQTSPPAVPVPVPAAKPAPAKSPFARRVIRQDVLA